MWIIVLMDRRATKRYCFAVAPTKGSMDALGSKTVDGTDLNLIPDPIDRDSNGNRVQGLKNADGGTTFSFQSESPGAEKESNWLPTGSGPWFPIMRLYVPHREVVDATWECPPLRRVD